MTWVFAVVVVAVLAVVAVVATGRGGELAPAYDDRPDVRVQADGPLTAEDLAGVRFTTALRGYRTSEVDALIDRLVSELQARSQVTLRPDAVREAEQAEQQALAWPTTADDAGPADRPSS